MADLTNRNADETVPDIATWGTGNVLETGEGTVKVDLDGKVAISDIINNLTSEDENKPLSAKQGKLLNDNKASLSGGSDADFALMPFVDGNEIIRTGSNANGSWIIILNPTGADWVFMRIDFTTNFSGRVDVDLPLDMGDRDGVNGATLIANTSDSDAIEITSHIGFGGGLSFEGDFIRMRRSGGPSISNTNFQLIVTGRL